GTAHDVEQQVTNIVLFNLIYKEFMHNCQLKLVLHNKGFQPLASKVWFGESPTEYINKPDNIYCFATANIKQKRITHKE
ncbi:MAG: hypothetical protein MUF71_04495, partial [Candidatus Kapabacteria bacterium]|nr:hypothetical protein [Candidatus Kapabacteria bacterium]